jgi:hypothetical protein
MSGLCLCLFIGFLLPYLRLHFAGAIKNRTIANGQLCNGNIAHQLAGRLDLQEPCGFDVALEASGNGDATAPDIRFDCAAGSNYYIAVGIELTGNLAFHPEDALGFDGTID